MKPARRSLLRATAAGGAAVWAPLFGTPGSARARALSPRRLEPFVEPLPVPTRLAGASLQIPAVEFVQKLHRDLPATRLWGYAGSYPGPTIEATRGVAMRVRFTNELRNPALLPLLPVDATLHWADPLGESIAGGKAHGASGHGASGHGGARGAGGAAASRRPRGPYRGPVPLVPHLHGGETEPQSDGHPDAWFTPGFERRGSGFVKESLDFANQQPPGTLWYHDHALGITRLTVYAGLAGFYIVRDPALEREWSLPRGAYEREIVIQDRSFDTAGQLLYPRAGTDPSRHTHWVPEFFGDTIVVNGKLWPFMEVEPRRYRLRLLNGSNARFYRLRLSDGRPFVVVGADGGMLPEPAPTGSIVLSPGERADVVVDFAGASRGARLRLLNDAPTPFPDGEEPDPNTTGQILEFRIGALSAPDDSVVPQRFAPLPELGAPTVTRRLTLEEQMGPRGPVAVLLDGKLWNDPVTETPQLGATEWWEIYNLTADTHPIHLHLVHMRLLGRHKARVEFVAEALRRGQDPTPFLQGELAPPEPTERGWKDTVRANPGEMTRFAVRFAPMAGGSFPFDATAKPGYVWHCHILEHEDNEMMRPMVMRR
jgi:FtsP/CotA-like multicopper oxidase with cupredoxin domain